MNDQIGDAAFKAWQDFNNAHFHLMMAFRHNSADDLRTAATMMQAAADKAFRALPDEAAADGVAA